MGSLARFTFIAAMLACATAAAAASIESAATLREQHARLKDRLEKNAFNRPIALDSKESGSTLKGDVYAELKQPYARVRDALADARGWCELLTLPFNVQKCEAQGERLTVSIGRKPDSPLEEATQLKLRLAVLARTDELLQVELTAPEGPAGTRDYRIAFTATPLEPGRTFVHMGYGYATGAMSRLALQAYLSTSGADKVGFSAAPAGEGRDGLVGGLRGVLERNTMRYFLAIESYLATLEAPADARRQKRLEHWFDATEKYPRQLREMSRDRYLAIKQGKKAEA